MFCKLCIILLFFLTFLKSSYAIGGASHVVLEVKNLRIIARDARDSSWIPGSGRRYLGVRRATHSIFLPGKFHGERSLVGYSPAAAAAKSLQSCPTLCDPINSSPPGSPVPGILQARTLEWVAIPFSNAWKWKVKVKSLSRVRLLATPWTAAHQAPPSMGFSSQEYWSGVPLPSPKLRLTLLQSHGL